MGPAVATPLLALAMQLINDLYVGDYLEGPEDSPA